MVGPAASVCHAGGAAIAAPSTTKTIACSGTSSTTATALTQAGEGNQCAISIKTAQPATASPQAVTKGAVTNQGADGSCTVCQSASCSTHRPVPVANAPPMPQPNATTQSSERALRNARTSTTAVPALPTSSAAVAASDKAGMFSGARAIGLRSTLSSPPSQPFLTSSGPCPIGKASSHTPFF